MSKKAINHKRQSNWLTGFIFIELMLVIAIFAVTLPLLLQSFISVTLLNERSQNSTIAISHAQYVMEEIKDTYFNNIADNINNGNWDWNSAAISSNGLGALVNENINTEVSGTDLLNIIITVSWNDRDGRIRNTQLNTLITKP